MSKVHTSEYQREQLLALGDMLRQARLAQGKSLSEVAQTTLIRQPLLEAIESANLAELPEMVYVQGLLRRYAEALGLDGQTIAGQYFARPVLRHSRPSWSGFPLAQLRPLHLYSAYVLLIMVSISGLAYLMRQATPEAAAPPILDQDVVEQLLPRQQANDSPAPQPAADADPAPLDSAVVVELELTEQSWVRVVADGKTEFEGMLQQGDARAWSADEAITVRAGNAGGVVVSHNRSEPQPMGLPGTVEEQTFNANETASVLRQQADRQGS